MPSMPTSTGEAIKAPAKARREQHGKIGADGIEPTMGEVHDAAEREDQRQPERDEEVICADEEAVQHLLEKEDELHAAASHWFVGARAHAPALEAAGRDREWPSSDGAHRRIVTPLGGCRPRSRRAPRPPGPPSPRRAG